MKQTYPLLWFAAIALLPVIAAHACLAPFWLPPGDFLEVTWLPVAQILLTALVVPGWLAFLGCRSVLRHLPVNIPIDLSLILTALAINVFLDYALWGISTGRFWTPDGQTIMIVKLIAQVGVGITLIPPSIASAIRYCRYRKGYL